MTMVYESSFSTNVSPIKYTAFLYHRFSRIYPIYFVIFIAMVFLIYYRTGEVDLNKISINLFLLQGVVGSSIVGASWSISIEILAYILFPFLIKAASNKKPTGFIMVILGFIMICITPTLKTYPTSGPLDIYNGIAAIIRGISGFLIGSGVFLTLKTIDIPIIKKPLVSDAIIAMMACLLIFKGGDILYVALCSILIPSLLYGKSFTRAFLSTRIMVFLGEISLSMYLIHPVIYLSFGSEISNAINNYIGNIIYRPYIFLLITIILSVITYYLIEMPARKILRKSQPKFFKEI